MEKFLSVNTLYKSDPDLKQEDVEMLSKWCDQQKHFPKVLDIQIALALHSCYYSVEQAKNCLENYFTIRGMVPELFSNGNPDKSAPLKQAMEVNLVSILPQRTKENYIVVLAKLMDTNPDLYNPQLASKVFDMQILRHVYTEGPSSGVLVIIDMTGGVFGHLLKMNLTDFKKFLVYIQDAMPIRLIGVHFINVVPFMDKILALLKPFIRKEFFSKIFIHTNMDTFYEHVPKEALPVDYGGEADSVNYQFEKYKKQIYDNQWFYDFQDTMVVDEGKRVGPRKDADSLFGFDGTFRKLSVD
ncbi:alpha-tocopherol transfer protein-like [Anthonomus grandis grandis]|uniref:alpha-tocopherol transfer protein-like n=1 Tax=Anthonomus grandis grandis TaxID=2921223 RepID=UPI00216552C9|nr:alpha-tocopherol transfer protein-like [Anthonomus grandis grandis]